MHEGEVYVFPSSLLYMLLLVPRIHENVKFSLFGVHLLLPINLRCFQMDDNEMPEGILP